MTPALPCPARPTRRAAVVAFLGFAAAAGCGPTQDVHSYTVPKAAEPKANPPAAPVDTPQGPEKVRFLGAVIPRPGQSNNRFVKFTGPSEKITPHVAAFDAFINSIRVPADLSEPLTYTAPKDGREVPARPGQMRQVTFQFGPPDAPVDLYLSSPIGGNLLENVNRWRREVGLPEVTEAELPSVTTEVQLGGTKAYKMDFRGPGGKGGGMGMMPPFAGR